MNKRPLAARTANWVYLPFWVGAATVVGGFSLLVTFLSSGTLGFPLDDAWIHQTYARNLATTGQWAFIPGQVSAGSTSPLWSLLLSLGYLLGCPYLLWTYALGILALGLTAWTANNLSRQLFPQHTRLGLVTGLLCLGEWHLVWAAVSGMETVLFCWLALLLCWLWQRTSPKSTWRSFLRLGLVGGLLTLTRPEGMLLVGLIGLAIGWQHRRQWRTLLAAWLSLAAGVSVLIVPYVVFHLVTAGTPFPNTFYAKQQEYRALLSLSPLWQRWMQMSGVTLVGGQVLLVPGFLYGIWLCASRKMPESTRLGMAVLTAWWCLHLTLYAFRLPVTYQHGRYLLPILPVFLLTACWGTAEGLALVRNTIVARILHRAMAVAAGLVFLVFLTIGARAYAADVGFIQNEMVTTAEWLSQNTERDTLVAVHDIGAVGYFSDRPLLDLAGLVTPQVIPFIDDEKLLLAWMSDRGAEYVVFFPDWSDAYRRMAADPRLTPVFSTGYTWTRMQGGENMTIYRLVDRKNQK